MKCLRFLAALAVAVVLVSCKEPGDGKVHVTYWEKWTGDEGEAMQRAVDAFNRSQDRIIVEYLPVSDIQRKTIVATAGGDPPDIAGLWSTSVYALADADALTPLNAFIEAAGGTTPQFLERYSPVYARMCEYRGKLWSLPSSGTVTALYWNKALFRQAGLDRPPRTVEELDAFSEKLTRRDAAGRITQLGFLPQEPGNWIWAFPVWFGGKLFTDDGITIGRDPRNLEAFRWIEGYTRRAGLDNLRTFSSGFGSINSPQSAFFSGKIAMVVQGAWLDAFIRKHAPGLDYGVAPWPAAVAGIDDFTVAHVDVYVIPRGAKHPKEAWEFLHWMATPRTDAKTFDELAGVELLTFRAGLGSPLRTWSPYYTANHPNRNIAIFRQLAGSPHAASPPAMGIWNAYSGEISTAFDLTRLLIEPPERALAFAQERAEKLWKLHEASTARRAGSKTK